MIKKKIPGMSKKEMLRAKAKNRIYNFVLDDGKIRGALIHGTYMIDEMRLNHQLGILETLVLGHAYLGVGLMTANLKNKGDQIAFKIECSGPIKGLSVEANAHGEVRGYLKTNPIPLDKPLESFDLSPFFGEGYLMVTRYPQYAKSPYVGHVKLKYRSIAKDLANYFLTSEQTPTALNLSVKFDTGGNVIGSGGLLLQIMPDAEEKDIGSLEQLLKDMPSIGEEFSNNRSPEEFIDKYFHQYGVKILKDRRIEFFCRCRKNTIEKVISKLPRENLEELVKNGPFPIDVHCHNCNTVYRFDKEEIEKFLQQAPLGTEKEV